MWHGVMKAWSTIQSGLEQQDPTSWLEIARQPLFGNKFLTNEEGIKWGTTPRSIMLRWANKDYLALKDIAKQDGYGWRTFLELSRLRRSRASTTLFTRLVNSIPWDATPMPTPVPGQWVAENAQNGCITQIYHVQPGEPPTTTLYTKDQSDNLQLNSHQQHIPTNCREVRIVRTGGLCRTVLALQPNRLD
jgi:hypothetical protein